jgi:hypothetical protein
MRWTVLVVVAVLGGCDGKGTLPEESTDMTKTADMEQAQGSDLAEKPADLWAKFNGFEMERYGAPWGAADRNINPPADLCPAPTRLPTSAEWRIVAAAQFVGMASYPSANAGISHSIYQDGAAFGVFSASDNSTAPATDFRGWFLVHCVR